MARSLICVGDRITHGGVVVSGTIATDIHGRLVARVGDRVVCEKHGPTVIVSGDPTLIIDGKPVAREGDKTACGATLIAGQWTTYVDPGSDTGTSTGAATAPTPAAKAAAALAGKPPICADCLLAGSRSGAPLLGR
ncbi:PAAR domain-containing protein [Luteimonas sp. SJ-92]|uniref:PAAR domain-containing protein n=1 Tax=Luteimonas salinisoli TaxID=2752307 RepID=A0A853J856_9GAMM|nr:PAAR domain-containing protein [Luteimonas salinisoli]NZA24924.1 PAAR domain-containing protein [Luteimonas salinisoli]